MSNIAGKKHTTAGRLLAGVIACALMFQPLNVWAEQTEETDESTTTIIQEDTALPEDSTLAEEGDYAEESDTEKARELADDETEENNAAEESEPAEESGFEIGAIVSSLTDLITGVDAAVATLTMGDADVLCSEAKANGIVITFTLQDGFTFQQSQMTNLSSQITYTYTSTGSTGTYLKTALDAATVVVGDTTLTITVPALDASFTNYISGTSSGDIDITVTFADDALAIQKTGDTTASVTALLVDNTLTILEEKAAVYVLDGNGNKVNLTESDIRSGAERYLAIEQLGTASGSQSWTFGTGSNGWTRRPLIAVNAFSTVADATDNTADEASEFGKIEAYWCEEDDTVVNGNGGTEKNRYYSLD